MFSQILPLAALLFGSACLVFAGGINALILPIRGELDGFTSTSLGLLGTGWAIGYIAGCIFTPRIVQRVGHVRSFGVLCSMAAITVLLSLLLISPVFWIPLRAISGVCFSGTAMIVESWLNERAEPSTRGAVFGTYTMISLTATTAGQMSLALGDPSGYFYFVLAAIIYCAALLPTALSASASPQPLVGAQLDLAVLWRNSPVAVFSSFMIGVSNAAFGTLSPVFAARNGLDLADIALFASLPLLAGAATQIPVGWLSDKFDRRAVLLTIAVLALGADTAFFVLRDLDRTSLFMIVTVFGATVFVMYPVIVSHASDHATTGNFIQIGAGILLVYGIGSVVGPTVAGFAMSHFGASSLFLVTGIAHVAIIVFGLARIMTSTALSSAQKNPFQPAPLGRVTTPETVNLATDAVPEEI